MTPKDLALYATQEGYQVTVDAKKVTVSLPECSRWAYGGLARSAFEVIIELDNCDELIISSHYQRIPINLLDHIIRFATHHLAQAKETTHG